MGKRFCFTTELLVRYILEQAESLEISSMEPSASPTKSREFAHASPCLAVVATSLASLMVATGSSCSSMQPKAIVKQSYDDLAWIDAARELRTGIVEIQECIAKFDKLHADYNLLIVGFIITHPQHRERLNTAIERRNAIVTGCQILFDQLAQADLATQEVIVKENAESVAKTRQFLNGLYESIESARSSGEFVIRCELPIGFEFLEPWQKSRSDTSALPIIPGLLDQPRGELPVNLEFDQGAESLHSPDQPNFSLLAFPDEGIDPLFYLRRSAD